MPGVALPARGRLPCACIRMARLCATLGAAPDPGGLGGVASGDCDVAGASEPRMAETLGAAPAPGALAGSGAGVCALPGTADSDSAAAPAAIITCCNLNIASLGSIWSG